MASDHEELQSMNATLDVANQQQQEIIKRLQEVQASTEQVLERNQKFMDLLERIVKSVEGLAEDIDSLSGRVQLLEDAD